MQQLKVGMNMEGESEKEQGEVKNDGMDMDEEMMMAGCRCLRMIFRKSYIT